MYCNTLAYVNQSMPSILWVNIRWFPVQEYGHAWSGLEGDHTFLYLRNFFNQEKGNNIRYRSYLTFLASGYSRSASYTRRDPLDHVYLDCDVIPWLKLRIGWTGACLSVWWGWGTVLAGKLRPDRRLIWSASFKTSGSASGWKA